MSAIVHKPVSRGHFGEADFADKLTGVLSLDDHLWFNAWNGSFNEIDAVLLRHEIGVFVLEVKALALKDIESFDIGGFKLRGDKTRNKSPLEQAVKAMYGLLNYAKSTQGWGKDTSIYFEAAVVFPRIERQAFLDKFGDSVANIEQKLIFADDLRSLSTLDAALKRGLKFKRPAKPNAVAMLNRLLGECAPPTPEERQKIAQIEGKKNRRGARLEQFLVPSQHDPVVIWGHAGTGKTQHLLRIALSHVKAGKKVAFFCYNRVLAGDIKRLAELIGGRGVFVDLTVSTFHKMFFEVQRKTAEKHTPGETKSDEGKLRYVAKLSKSEIDHNGLGFDSIFVDEGQDVAEWMFQLSELLLNQDGELFVALDPDQSLYNPKKGSAPTLLGYLDNRDYLFSLRRVNRSAALPSLAAQAFVEKPMEEKKFKSWVFERKPVSIPAGIGTKDGSEDFEEMGLLPKITYVPAAEYQELRASILRKTLQEELKRVAFLDHPGDLAIIWNNDKECIQKEVVKADLLTLKREMDRLHVPYLDQSDMGTNVRDQILPAGHVRIVPFRCSRGIECERAIVLGLDGLVNNSEAEANGVVENGSKPQRSAGQILTYIVLTRSRNRTTVISSPNNRGEFSNALDLLIGEYSKLDCSDELSKEIPVIDEPTSAGNWAKARFFRRDGIFHVRIPMGNWGRKPYSQTLTFFESRFVGDAKSLKDGDTVFVDLSGNIHDPSSVVVSPRKLESAESVAPGFKPGYVTRVNADGSFEAISPYFPRTVQCNATVLGFDKGLNNFGSSISTGKRVDLHCGDPSDGMVPAYACILRSA